MVWCPFDHRYFCGKCFRDVCQPVHGSKPATKMGLRIVGIGALVTFGSLLVPFSLSAILLAGLTPTPGDSITLGYVLLGVVGAGAMWIAATSAVRGVLHRRAVRDHTATPLESLDDARNHALPWRPNHAAPPRRLAVLAAVLAVSAVLAGVFAAWLLIGPPPYYLLIVTGLSVATMAAAVAAFFASLPIAVPSAIALAPDGVHFWYDSPLDRRTQRDVMPWVDLNILGMAAAGGMDPGQKLVRFMRIDSDNAGAVVEAWQRHRIDRTSPRHAPAPETGAAPPRPYLAPQAPPPPMASRANLSITPGRGTMCARCHVRFPGMMRLRLLWCRVDRFYVCRRCWEDGCMEGHGRGMRAVSKPYRLAAGLVVTAVLLAIWFPAVFYDYSLTNAWANAPTVSISTLQAGELVKVQGMIVSGGLVALGGHEVYYSKTGWSWLWNTTQFELSDGSGSVLVSTAEWYVFYNGLHWAPYAIHTQMTMYSQGDYVQIVGTMGTLPDGTLTLDAQIMASLEWVTRISLAPSALTATLLYVIPITILGFLGGGAIVFTLRSRTHRRAVHGHPAVPIAAADEARDPGLGWQPNGRGTTPGRRSLWAGIAVAIGVAVLALFPGLAPRAESGYFSLGLVGLVVIMFEAFIVYMILFGGVGHPSFVAAADDGFRMWYDSPYDRHLNDTIFPWDQIKDIHLTGGKNRHWVLQWTTGETTNLYMLRGGNLQLLLTEYARRRIPSSD